MWKTAKLGDVCSFTRGLTYSKKDEVKHSHKSVLRATNIDLASYSLNLDDIRYISDSVIIKNDKLAKSGDILICTASGSKSHLGKVALITEDMKMAFGSFMGAIRTNTNCLPSFLFSMLISSSFKKYLLDVSGGTNINNLKFSQIKNYEFLLPPLHEQQAIADVLSTWDEAIEITERLIKAKEKQFRWLLRTLIGDQCEKSGWKKVKLGEIGTFSKGYGITKTDLTNSGAPCVRYGDIYTRHNFTVKNFSSFIDEKTAEKSVRINPNDLLFAGSGETADEIGKCVAFNMDTEAYAGGDVIILRITTKDNADYVSYFLNTVGRRQLNKLGAGNSIVHIYSKDLQHVRIDVPPPSEQKEMIKIFQSAEKEIELLGEIVSQYRIQKRGLMQKLLTGEWRIKTKA